MRFAVLRLNILPDCFGRSVGLWVCDWKEKNPPGLRKSDVNLTHLRINSSITLSAWRVGRCWRKDLYEPVFPPTYWRIWMCCSERRLLECDDLKAQQQNKVQLWRGFFYVSSATPRVLPKETSLICFHPPKSSSGVFNYVNRWSLSTLKGAIGHIQPVWLQEQQILLCTK